MLRYLQKDPQKHARKLCSATLKYLSSVLVDFYFAQTFFPKNLLPNSGCGLSTGAAYTRVNTVFVFIYFVLVLCTIIHLKKLQ